MNQAKLVKWQYCKNLNDINKAILQNDQDWEELKSAEQIISITFDTTKKLECTARDADGWSVNAVQNHTLTRHISAGIAIRWLFTIQRPENVRSRNFQKEIRAAELHLCR